MNWTTAVIIGNQLYNNAQTSRINRRIGELYNQLQDESDQAEHQRLIKQIIFEFRELVEDLHGKFSGKQLYAGILEAQLKLQMQGIGVQDFTELADKEYARQVLNTAEKIKSNAVLDVEDGELQKIEQTIRSVLAIELCKMAQTARQH